MTFRPRDYRLLIAAILFCTLAILAKPTWDFVDSCIEREMSYEQRILDSHISPSDRERVMVWVQDERK